MKVRRLKPQTDAYVRLSLGRGVILILLFDEYKRALWRGKMEARARRRALAAERQRAQDEAKRLGWIDREPSHDRGEGI